MQSIVDSGLLAGLKGSLLLRKGMGGEAQKGLQHQAQLGLNPALDVIRKTGST